jgi:hypothetical protein
MGVIPYPEASAWLDAFRVAVPLGILPGSATSEDWGAYVIAADDQGKEPSCVGRAWAGWMEAMLRRYGPASPLDQFEMQIDAGAIWRKGREMFHGGALDGGLHLHEGGQAAIALGILPPGTELVRLHPGWMPVGEALAMTPIIQAHGIGAGWHRPDRQSGCIDHTAASDPGRYGYHATLLCERFQDERGRWLLFQNSWSAKWGYHGFGILRADAWHNSLIPSGLWTARLPDDWLNHKGWKSFLVDAIA